MGFLDAIFGSKSKVKTGTMDLLTPEQRSYLNQLMGQVSQTGQLGYWPGAEKSANWFAQQTAPYWSSDFIEQAFNPQATREYWTKTVMPAYQETVVPQINAAFAGPGYYGTARARAQQESAEHMGQTLATQLYQEDLTRRQQEMALEAARREAMINLLGQGTVTPSTYYQMLASLATAKTLQPYQYVEPGSSGLLGALAPVLGYGLGSWIAGGGLSGLFGGGLSPSSWGTAGLVGRGLPTWPY
jgi:hypothetical protein